MFYLLQASDEIFPLKTMLFGEESWTFIWQVMVRSVIMFIVSLTTLRLLGKRGIKQGVFEVVVIITLGSAAGDAMFYSKVGLVPAVLVFVMIILMYKVTNYLVAQSRYFQKIIEGHPIRLVEDGQFYYPVIKSQSMAQDEYLPDLRLKGITQMGQVSHAFIEASGEISIVYFEDNEVKYGMPTLPGPYDKRIKTIIKKGIYACVYCSNIEDLEPVKKKLCPVCKHSNWVVASNEKRVR